MCFIVTNKQKVATKDIVCYKVFNKGAVSENKKSVRSYWQNFKYDFGYEYWNTPLKTTDNNYKIEEGLHSYSTKRMAKYSGWSGTFILQCIIPKGSKYYYNHYKQEYVSDKIIIGDYNTDVINPSKIR
jgi:hypothetical protein